MNGDTCAKESEFKNGIERIIKNRIRVDAVIDNLQNLRDRLYGTTPETNTSSAKAKSSRSGDLGRFEDYIENLESSIDTLQQTSNSLCEKM